ncbi:MAG: ATP-binding protein [FCB group bacterium]|nr:ATP-binding protein [FCB group bacterium]
MLNQTFDQLSEMKLNGIKTALKQQLEQPGTYAGLSFEERLTHLIDREAIDRQNRKIIRLQRLARLKFRQACIGDIIYKKDRNLHRDQIRSLSHNQWLVENQNMIITGATGTGKTWLACALADNAIAAGYPVHYIRISQLMSQVLLVRGDGSYLKWLKKLSRFTLLILDDLGLSSLTTQQAQELLEVIEERSGNGSCIVTSQLSVKEWYSYFKNPTLADAIMDRLAHNSHRIELEGDSMREYMARAGVEKSEDGKKES